ncbi:cellulose biosynthesis protein BcsS [Acidithiobacillus sp.]|uniref:cellulose biosynthesis protein BcsS n=1 Tax=Acidithiobacillus sp. TaxID=1872118 RepID=UPI003D06F398
MAMRHRIGMAVLMGMCMGVDPAMAQPLLLGGTQLAPENSYSYLGAIMPFAGSRLGSGWFGTVFATYLTYHFQAGYPTEKVSAKVPGFNAGLGYGWQGPSYQLAISGSLGYQYFSIHPYDVVTNGQPKPVGGPLGGTVTFTPQIQARYDFTPMLYASTMASYSFGQRAYWSRFRGGIRPVSWLSFGPEGVLQGGVNYRIHQVGAFISVALGDGWSVEGEGGVNYTSGLPSTGYGGFSFAKAL